MRAITKKLHSFDKLALKASICEPLYPASSSIPKAALVCYLARCKSRLQVSDFFQLYFPVVSDRYIMYDEEAVIWIQTCKLLFNSMNLNESIFLSNLDRTFQKQFCVSFPNIFLVLFYNQNSISYEVCNQFFL